MQIDAERLHRILPKCVSVLACGVLLGLHCGPTGFLPGCSDGGRRASFPAVNSCAHYVICSENLEETKRYLSVLVRWVKNITLGSHFKVVCSLTRTLVGQQLNLRISRKSDLTMTHGSQHHNQSDAHQSWRIVCCWWDQRKLLSSWFKYLLDAWAQTDWVQSSDVA